jgi:very-short-patch-repair endonuclease
MADIGALVLRLGGVAQKRQLVALGARDVDLTRAVRAGSVVRVRQGWYSTMGEVEPCIQAVRIGGRLTGISAIIHLGGWVLGSHPLHVSLADNAARLRDPLNRRRSFQSRRGVFLHWERREVGERGSALCVGLVDALVRVVLDEDLETAVAALDWALHTGRLDRFDLERILLELPADRRWIAGWVDVRCESLPESLSRTRLRVAGHRVTSQVGLGSERIDLVVDGIVGLEVDGEQFHVHRFEQDRRKDLAITLAGYHALRPSARMVFSDWDRVARAIAAAIRARGAPTFGNSGLPPERRPKPSGGGGRRRPKS